MTSWKKIEANRRNGARGTGPRTAQGKARSCQNSFKHGLARSICDDPRCSADIDRLARALADGDHEERLALAREAAAAWLELDRVRMHRTSILNHPPEHSDQRGSGPMEVTANGIGGVKGRVKVKARKHRNAPANANSNAIDILPIDPESAREANATSIAVSALAVLDRYERRAFSRYRRLFSELETKTTPSVQP